MFVVVWLNLALQPCAMATGVDDDHECPTCPPSHTREHDGHELSPDAMGEHGVPCVMGETNCDLPDESNIDWRTGQIKLEDGPSDLAPAVVATAPWLTNMSAERVMLVTPFVADPPGTAPPLNILYCVYLD